MAPRRFVHTSPSPQPLPQGTWEPQTSQKFWGTESLETKEAGVPGIRCPKCLNRGVEVWVIPGKICRVCGHPCG
ncbi:hypothetical protein CDD81_3073 [Ophiocordyceps australis]|uniref:Uncharacterized protein n=1 Tax=Ophiocordyceps australis TaxID=1399860 RepID=A0A2C5YE03_9HYPO|nr:hypothetical protein CDD81_3073 [Ophiocordyceps australis]